MNTLAQAEMTTTDTLAAYRGNAGLLAMQYCYTLPADYDMSIIRRRIAAKGHLMNGFPDLLFKAFSYSARDYNHCYSQTNRYAPFYVWRSPSGMNRFLQNPGFAALVQSFGWPVIKTWSVLSAQFRDTFSIASWATRELVDIPAYTQLEQLQREEAGQISEDIASKRILGALSAFEPTAWTLVRYKLWSTCPTQLVNTKTQIYQVGQLAT